MVIFSIIKSKPAFTEVYEIKGNMKYKKQYETAVLDPAKETRGHSISCESCPYCTDLHIQARRHCRQHDPLVSANDSSVTAVEIACRCKEDTL